MITIDYKAVSELQKQRIEQLERAILWALGEDDSDFGDNFVDGKGPFQWRTELRERAGMPWRQVQSDAANRSP